MVGVLMLSQGQAYDSHYLLNLLLDQDFGLHENLVPDTYAGISCHEGIDGSRS